MRISDWSSDVCSSDLDGRLADARIADIERIVLRAAAEDLDGALHLLAATDQRIDLSVAGLLVQIHAELLERAFALLLRLRLHLLFLLGRALRLARFGRSRLGNAVADEGDGVEPRHVLLLQEIDGIALALREHGDHHEEGKSLG